MQSILLNGWRLINNPRKLTRCFFTTDLEFNLILVYFFQGTDVVNCIKNAISSLLFRVESDSNRILSQWQGLFIGIVFQNKN